MLREIWHTRLMMKDSIVASSGASSMSIAFALLAEDANSTSLKMCLPLASAKRTRSLLDQQRRWSFSFDNGSMHLLCSIGMKTARGLVCFDLLPWESTVFPLQRRKAWYPTSSYWTCRYPYLMSKTGMLARYRIALSAIGQRDGSLLMLSRTFATYQYLPKFMSGYISANA